MTYFDDFEYFVTFSFIMDSVRFAPVPSTVDLVILAECKNKLATKISTAAVRKGVLRRSAKG